MASGLTIFLWNYALRHVPASAAALYVNLIPVVGLGFSVLVGETVGAEQLLGGTLAVAGVLLGRRHPEVTSTGPWGPAHRLRGVTSKGDKWPTRLLTLLTY